MVLHPVYGKGWDYLGQRYESRRGLRSLMALCLRGCCRSGILLQVFPCVRGRGAGISLGLGFRAVHSNLVLVEVFGGGLSLTRSEVDRGGELVVAGGASSEEGGGVGLESSCGGFGYFGGTSR